MKFLILSDVLFINVLLILVCVMYFLMLLGLILLLYWIWVVFDIFLFDKLEIVWCINVYILFVFLDVDDLLVLIV